MEQNNKSKNKPFFINLIVIYAVLAILFTIYSIVFYKQTNVGVIEYWKTRKEFPLINFNMDNSEIIGTTNVQQEEQIENETIDIKVSENNNQSTTEPIKVKESLGKYYVNNLEIEEIKEERGELIESSFDLERRKLSIEYFKISGLINKEIQENINTEIKNKIETLILEEEILNEEIEHIMISASLYGNFQDVISINFYKSISYKTEIEGEDEYDYITECLNYRLDTGEEIKFEDLFTEDASLKKIISESAYEQLCFNYLYEEENFFGNMEEIDYSEIENNVFKIVSEFNKNNDVKFYFTEAYVYINLDSMEYLSIDFSNYIDYLNIYNLVKIENSLYENGNKDKRNYLCTSPIYDEYECFEKISDNIFLGIESYSAKDNPNYYQYKEKLKEIIKQEENTKGYIYNLSIQFLEETQEFHGYGQMLEVGLEDFDKKIDEFLFSVTGIPDPLYGFGLLQNELVYAYNIVLEQDEVGEVVLLKERVFLEEPEEVVLDS